MRIRSLVAAANMGFIFRRDVGFWEFIARVGAVWYWVSFAAYTLWVAQEPGHWDPTTRQYPWRGVLVILAELGLETYMLYWIVRPGANFSFWQRAGVSLAFVWLMLKCTSWFVYDAPPYVSVPATYAIVTTAVLLVVVPLTAFCRSRRD